MGILKQLIREFWIPLLGAIIWTIVNYFNSSNDNKNLTDLVNIAMPSFFFASWMTGQYFRVKKQNHVATTLTKIEDRVGSVLEDISQQSADMKLITDTQLYQTFDLCLDYVREVKEEMSDRNRLFKKEKNIDIEKFEFYHENPFYQSKRFLNRLIKYAAYTLNLNREEELEDRYTRTAYHCEELTGTITTLIGKMNHEKLDWKTPKSQSLLNEISILIQQLKKDIIPHSRYNNETYKGNNLNSVLDTHISNLNKFSK